MTEDAKNKAGIVKIETEVLADLRDYVGKTGQSLKWFVSTAVKEKMQREPVKEKSA